MEFGCKSGSCFSAAIGTRLSRRAAGRPAHYLGGELVTDVTNHPAFRNTARSFARIYDRKRDAQNNEAMSFAENGERFTSWFLLPRTRAELEQRAECHRRVAEWSYGLLGRSADHVPAFIGGMAMVPELFEANRAGFGNNVVDYFDFLKRNDLFACYLVLTPQLSRERTRDDGAASVNPAMTIVKEDDDGIVVRGLKLLGTSAVFSDEAWIGSMIPLGPDQIDQAVTFALPINAPGVELWVRRSFEQSSANGIDNFFSSQFDESDCVMVLETCAFPGSGCSAIAACR